MAFIQGNTGNAAPSCAIQFTTQNVTPGSILVAIARVVAGGTATLSDSDVTNVWIKAYEGLTAPSNNYVVWYCLNATGGAKNTLTIASTSSLYIRAAIGEWGGSGADNFAYTLGTVATGGSSNPATANAIKAYGSELILAFAFQTAISSATATAGGGFTTRVSNPAIANDVAIADVSATAGSYTPTVTYDSNTLWTIVPIAFNVSSYAVTSFNDVWTPKGTVIANSGGSQNGQPTVLHEGGSQCGLGAGNVFKMYYSNSGTTPGVYYAESLDGETGWTSSGVSNPIIAGQGFQRVYKSGTTYYCYSSSATSPGPAINVYTCTDGTGVNFSLAKANAIVVGSAGEWDSASVWQLNVCAIVSGTWYGYYTGTKTGGAATDWSMGLATSTDGINWAKASGNPRANTAGTSNFTWAKVGSLYYGWSQDHYPSPLNAIPTGIFRWSSSSPSGPWTPAPYNTFYSTLQSELYADATGAIDAELGDPCILEANGNVYLYYSAGYNLVNAFVVNCAIAYGKTLAQLVTGYEGVLNVPIPYGLTLNNAVRASDSFASNDITNWTQLSSASGWGAAQITGGKMEAATLVNADSWWNGFVWLPDQWAQVTVAACTGPSAVGVSLRQSTSGAATCYQFFWYGTLAGSGTWCIRKYLNGSYTNLATGTGVSLNVGDTLTGVAIGTNLMLYWNGFLLDIVSDSAIASGAAGCCLGPVGNIANAQISAWSGGNFRNPPNNGIQGALGAGGSGATVAWTGTSSGSVTADVSGNYNTLEVLNPFDVLTLTPSKTGYTFSPTSASETVNGADITGVSFTATQTPTGGGSGSYMQAFRGFVNKRGVN